MTEIQWIINLMTNYKLPANAKKACIDRIGEVEARINTMPVRPIAMPQPVMSQAQAKYEAENLPPPQAITPNPQVQAAMMGKPVEVVTGHGTRGPRKF